MRPKPAAATVLSWLKGNGIGLGALTSHDTACLLAAVQIAAVWIRGDSDSKDSASAAFKNIVEQMQPRTRFMAFHAIAHVGEWSHRWALWMDAGLLAHDLQNVPECKFGPSGKNPEAQEVAQ